MDKRELILNTMQELFREGTAGTASVSDIAKKAGIAKGGLYYYFHSKEEVMDALIERQYHDIIIHCQDVLHKSGGNAVEKIALLLHTYSASYVDPSLDEYLHMPNNAAIHQKSLAKILLELTGILTELIEQGVKEQIFTCSFPKEYSRFLLSSFTFLFDPGIFTWSDAERLQMMKALADFLEKGLCTKKGTFSFFYATA